MGNDKNKNRARGVFRRKTGLALILIPCAIVASAALFAFSGKGSPREGGPLEFENTVWDFGEIREADGPVRHAFRFRNASGSPATIDHVSASCGCTTPSYPTYPIKSGASGDVAVTFDPEFRPGDFEKEVHVISAGNRYILTIKGRVIPRPRSIRDDYPFAMGDGVRVDRLLCEMSYVRQVVGAHAILGIANDSEKDAKVEFEISPDDGYLTVLSPTSVAAGARAEVSVRMSVPEGKRYGKFSYRITPVVNGVRQVLPVTVQGILTDPFDLTKIKSAPKADYGTVYHDFGTLGGGSTASAEFSVTNNGNAPLIIRWVESRPGITCTLKSGTKIEPGKSRSYTVTMDSSAGGSSVGRVSTTLMLVTNDPGRPVRNLTLEADIFNL